MPQLLPPPPPLRFTLHQHDARKQVLYYFCTTNLRLRSTKVKVLLISGTLVPLILPSCFLQRPSARRKTLLHLYQILVFELKHARILTKPTLQRPRVSPQPLCFPHSVDARKRDAHQEVPSLLALLVQKYTY